MYKRTTQMQVWQSDFGRQYTDRNSLSVEDFDRTLVEDTGFSKLEIYGDFFPSPVLAEGTALEVGCNVGMQLRMLQKVKPQWSLYGVDLLGYALVKAREMSPGITFVQATAFDLPFADASFELVMTNGVLIHLHPSDLPRALEEIYRCSSRYIFCHEYFSATPQEVLYRGQSGLLYKMDYMDLYQRLFPGLTCEAVRYLHYPDAGDGKMLTDQLCLLRKGDLTDA